MKKSKKIIIKLLIATALVTLLAIPTFAEIYSGECGKNDDDVNYLLDTETGRLDITGQGEMTSLPNSVPKSSVKNATISDGITAIGGSAFSGCENLTYITLPNSITSIGEYAFSGCRNLARINLPNNVTSIGNNAFSFCSNLKSITIPKNVTNIGKEAFYSCDLEEITLPFTGNGSDTTHFGYIFGASNYSYNKNYVPDSLKTVIITDTDSIADYAFFECQGLKKITLGNSITSIGTYAFKECCGITHITIPRKVTYIGERAFEFCSSLTSVAFETTDTYIEPFSFAYASNLKKVYIFEESTADEFFSPDLYIKVYLNESTNYTRGDFEYVSQDGKTAMITNYIGADDYPVIPSTIDGKEITGIGPNAFSDCRTLKGVTIPDTVTIIEDEAFYYCNRLSSIIIPDSVKWIGNNAFGSCHGLLIVTFEAKEAFQLANPFYDCPNLNTIYLYKNSFADEYFPSESYTKIYLDKDPAPESDFEYILNTNEKTAYLEKYIGDGGDVIIPETLGGYTVTTIGNSAFYCCSDLTSITIPEGVTAIGEFAFSGCNNLKSITIPFGVTRLEIYAFANCTSLTSVSLPSSLTKIDSAFSRCTALTTVNIPESITEINGTFSECSSLTNITIPNSVISIVDSAFYACKSLTSITFPDSVKIIGDYAFSNCDNLSEIYIPYGVETIGRDSFSNCDNLKKIFIPDSVTSIEMSAFEYCSSLNNVFIGNGITYLGKYSFAYCTSLTNVTIPQYVTVIGAGVFSHCYNLECVTIKTKDAYFNSDIFGACSNLKTVYLYSNTSADSYFDDISCTKIYLTDNFELDSSDFVCQLNSDETISIIGYKGNSENVVIPSKICELPVTAIGAYAFKGLKNITSLTIPSSITFIGSGAFDGCDNITSIIIGPNITSIGKDIFGDRNAPFEILITKGSFANLFFTNSIYANFIEYFAEYEEGDIKVHSKGENGFAEGASLVATSIPDDELRDFVISNSHGKNPDLVAYDIRFELDGFIVQPDGFVTVKIKVPKNFNGEHCKVYHYSDDGIATDMNAEYVDGYLVFQTDHFSIYVIADMPSIQHGDVNTDGTIDTKDAVLLAQYLAKWSVTINEGAADCNADGAVDTKDAVLLAQYLAKWDVTLG